MQTVWSVHEIARVAHVLARTSRNPEFAAGALALAEALNAVPAQRDLTPWVVVDTPPVEVVYIEGGTS